MTRSVTVLAAVLTTAALAACGGGSADVQTEPATTEAPATETATTEPATTDGGTTADDGATEEEDGTTAGTTETTGDGGGADVAARIALVAGEPQGGEKTIEATSGQRVRIVVRSDQTDELHLHGYDIEKEAEPGKPAVFAFRADLEGIFELESHVSHGVIARVVVNP